MGYLQISSTLGASDFPLQIILELASETLFGLTVGEGSKPVPFGSENPSVKIIIFFHQS